MYARREPSLCHLRLGVFLNDVDRRLARRRCFGKGQLEDAAFDDRFRLRADRIGGEGKLDIEKERAVLLEVLVVARGVLLAVGLDGEPAVVDRHLEGVGGDARNVEDEQVGVLTLEQIEEDVFREILQCGAKR